MINVCLEQCMAFRRSLADSLCPDYTGYRTGRNHYKPRIVTGVPSLGMMYVISHKNCPLKST